MFFLCKIARRYLFSRNVGRFGPMMSFVAILGIAISTAALITVLSVMRGFGVEVTKRLLGFGAHITIITQGDITSEEISSTLGYGGKVFPFVNGEIIAKPATSDSELALGAKVRGVPPEWFISHNKMKLFLGDERNLISEDGSSNFSGAIIGNELSAILQVHPAFDDEITLIAPLADLSPSGELSPNKKNFNVQGTFSAGVLDYDSKVILTPIDSAKELLGQQAEVGFYVLLDNISDLENAKSNLLAKFSENSKIVSFDEENRRLFAALKLERISMSIILFMALLISSLATAGVVMLVTASKRKDIAILRSIGMTSRDIRNVFLINAGFIGAVGSGIGFILGICSNLALYKWPIPLPSSYYLEFLPVDPSPLLAFLFALTGVLISVLASAIPVKSALQVSICEGLRYE